MNDNERRKVEGGCCFYGVFVLNFGAQQGGNRSDKDEYKDGF